MNIRDYWYNLPEDRIAQTPLKDRSSSKLLHLNRKTGEISHHVFSDILDFLNSKDILVLNDTKVLPSRLFGRKKETAGKCELLLLHRLDWNKWEALTKPAKRLRTGTSLDFGDLLQGKVIEEKEDGIRVIEFYFDGVFEEILDKLGTMPLPPYIHAKLEDKQRYQTVYAKVEGSNAAPTAGLHFTEPLLKSLEDHGVQIERVTLHVGLGTFRPVQVQEIEDHKMHREFYTIDPEVAERINYGKANGKRIICVGTTSVRTLESAAIHGQIAALSGWTDIFIYPPYTFQMADALITNFHLPESTLLLLVSAFSSREYILKSYEEAIEKKYRFFSFGDAMFIE